MPHAPVQRACAWGLGFGLGALPGVQLGYGWGTGGVRLGYGWGTGGVRWEIFGKPALTGSNWLYLTK